MQQKITNKDAHNESSLDIFLAIFLKNNWTHVLVQDRKETVLRPYNHIYMDFRNGLVALFNEKIFF